MPDATRFHYFEKGTRYYRVTLQQDLFGCWVVKREWGNIARRSVRCLAMPAANYDAALGLLEATIKRRAKRGYQEVGEDRCT